MIIVQADANQSEIIQAIALQFTHEAYPKEFEGVPAQEVEIMLLRWFIDNKIILLQGSVVSD